MAEIDAVWHGVSWVNIGAGAVSVGIVAYLGWALRRVGPTLAPKITPLMAAAKNSALIGSSRVNPSPTPTIARKAAIRVD